MRKLVLKLAVYDESTRQRVQTYVSTLPGVTKVNRIGNKLTVRGNITSSSLLILLSTVCRAEVVSDTLLPPPAVRKPPYKHHGGRVVPKNKPDTCNIL